MHAFKLSILIRDSLDNAKHNVDKDTLWGFTHTVGHRGPSENTIWLSKMFLLADGVTFVYAEKSRDGNSKGGMKGGILQLRYGFIFQLSLE